MRAPDRSPPIPPPSPALVGHELLEEPASFDGYLVVARGELDIASAFSLRDKLHAPRRPGCSASCST
jgi:hypothetical protein